VEERLAEKRAALNERHADEARARIARGEHNADLADQAADGPARRAEQRKIDRFDITQLLADRARAAGEQNEETQPASNQDASWV
jgi:hypothetical protein